MVCVSYKFPMLASPDVHTLAGREDGLQRDVGGHMVKVIAFSLASWLTALSFSLCFQTHHLLVLLQRLTMKMRPETSMGKHWEDSRSCRIQWYVLHGFGVSDLSQKAHLPAFPLTDFSLMPTRLALCSCKLQFHCPPLIICQCYDCV